MRKAAAVAAGLVWLLCWVIAPASWWVNEKLLNEQAFQASMSKALGIEDVDTQIADRVTNHVMDSAREFVDTSAPAIAPQADALLETVQPTVSSIVLKAVNSQPGQKALLEVATQTHNAFVAWLDSDTLGRPGLEADLDEGRATLDVDQMLAGQSFTVGPVSIPLDALNVPGVSVPVPLPPAWMRLPLNLVRSAFWPAVVGIVASGVLLAWLDTWRLRALGIAAAATAVLCGATALLIRTTWTLSGADGADWTLTRAIGELMVQPWLTAYMIVVVAMVVVALTAWLVERRRPVPIAVEQ